MADGLAVQVKIKSSLGGVAEQLYYVAVSDRAAAEKAVRDEAGLLMDSDEIEAKEPIKESDLREKGVQDGEVVFVGGFDPLDR